MPNEMDRLRSYVYQKLASTEEYLRRQELPKRTMEMLACETLDLLCRPPLNRCWGTSQGNLGSPVSVRLDSINHIRSLELITFKAETESFKATPIWNPDLRLIAVSDLNREVITDAQAFSRNQSVGLGEVGWKKLDLKESPEQLRVCRLLMATLDSRLDPLFLS